MLPRPPSPNPASGSVPYKRNRRRSRTLSGSGPMARQSVGKTQRALDERGLQDRVLATTSDQPKNTCHRYSDEKRDCPARWSASQSEKPNEPLMSGVVRTEFSPQRLINQKIHAIGIRMKKEIALPD